MGIRKGIRQERQLGQNIIKRKDYHGVKKKTLVEHYFKGKAKTVKNKQNLPIYDTNGCMFKKLT